MYMPMPPKPAAGSLAATKTPNTLQPVANPGGSVTATMAPGQFPLGGYRDRAGDDRGQRTGWNGADQPPGLLNQAMNSRYNDEGQFRGNSGLRTAPRGMFDPGGRQGGQHAPINWGRMDYGPWSGPGNYYHPTTGQFLGQGRENRYDWANDPDGVRGRTPGNGTSALSLLQALGAQRRTA